MIVNDLSAEEQHSLETPLITREFVPQEFSTTERNLLLELDKSLLMALTLPCNKGFQNE